MVRKSALLLSLLLLSVITYGQIYDPVKWDFGYEKKGGNNFELIFTATIEANSHIYSIDIPSGGPIPTSFTIDSIAGVKLEGKAYEVTKPVEVMDDAFGFRIKTFSDKAEFRQKISTDGKTVTVKGVVNYMACNNATCSPPKDVEFSVLIKGEETAPVIKSGNSDASVTPASGRGLLRFFLISLIAGLAGVLTPCVFPMIPMTVAFFSQGTTSRRASITRAVIFGLSIIAIYTLLGLIVSLTSAGAGFANSLSTHWLPNTIFFLLFIVFAVSFFGAFEIILPNSWVTGADSKVDKGGVLASFFMGLTTVIVSFSCTGPIVGALLVEAATGDVMRPMLGMLGFGIAFALPFTIFALFPSIMSRIPRSGGWLNSVKVVMGFIMLAFSMKFLMTVDGVYSLGLLSRGLFISIWIVLFTLLGLYLMGKIKFSHDSEVAHIGVFRLFLIIVSFTFVVYLIAGLFGAPLSGLSSFLPAQSRNDFNLTSMIRANNNIPVSAAGTETKSQLCSSPKYSDLFEMPLGLTGYFDYEQGLACAKEQGKPVLLDFKGHACANCKRMEAKVWSDPEVLKRLRDNFVIISLYVDDRTALPENEWLVSKIDGKQKKTIGKMWEDLEISLYKTNALPLYVITDADGKALNSPMPTNLNVSEYKQWLDDGVNAYRSVSK